MATYSTIHAQKIPWAQEPDGLRSIELLLLLLSQALVVVGGDLVTTSSPILL